MFDTFRRRRGALLTVALAAALLAAGTGVASATQTRQQDPSAAMGARRGVIPPKGTVRAAVAGDLEYHGGPIQEHPKVFLVFWGRQWRSDPNGVQDYMTSYFQGLGQPDDAWSTVTSQYDGQGVRPTFGTSVLGGVWVDTGRTAPAQATAGQIAAEARRG